MVIVDKEINQMEVDVLDNYLPLSKEDELYHQRMQIFSDDEERMKLKDILDKLVMANYWGFCIIPWIKMLNYPSISTKLS